MKRVWTDEQMQFLRDNYGVMSYDEMAAALGRSKDQIKTKAQRMKITVSRKWPSEEVEYIRAKYADTPTQHIADELGKPLKSVYSLAAKLGLKKSEEYLASPAACRLRRGDNVGTKTRFKKGQKAWNEGVKGICGTHENSRRTQFKKGIRPANRREIGDERIQSDGYVYVKVADGRGNKNWKQKQWLIWEQINGKVPARHLVAFKDGNKQNFAIENLELLSRNEWMKRNTMHNLPEPVKQQIHVLAGFKRRLNDYAKKQDRRPAESVV